MVRIYRYTNTKFQYEPCEFAFEGIKRGCRFYKPDFYLPDEDVYVELKGYLNGESKTRLKRMLKYHPTIATKMRIVVDKIFSRDLKLTKIASAIISLGYKVTQLQAYSPLEKTYRSCRGGNLDEMYCMRQGSNNFWRVEMWSRTISILRWVRSYLFGQML